MVELVDAARQLVNVGANQVRRGGMQGVFQRGAELGDRQHQILGVGVGGSLNGQIFPRAVTAENGLDPDNGV